MADAIVAAAPAAPAPTPAPPPLPGAKPAAAPVSFTGDQSSVVHRLGSTLSILAPLMLLLGVMRLAYGVIVIWKATWSGFWILPEGALLAFAGLALIAGATDARFLHEVKGREKEHLTNTWGSLNAAFTALLILGCYVAFINFFRVFFG